MSATDTTEEIVLEHIDEPPQAMRGEIDRDEIFDLAADIKKNGLINPITVRPREGRYEVVAGHRRFLAHRYGGMSKIRCVVRQLTDDEAFAIMTSENLARVDVNPVDEAAHTKRLMEMHSGDMPKVMEILNRGRDWVFNRLAIADMPDDLKDALRQEKIKLGVALALAEITDDVDRSACLSMAMAQGASVVVAQYWLAQWKAGLFGHATAYSVPDPNAPEGERKVVMLRCAVDGKEYPAHEFVSVLVCRNNVGFIEALRTHLNVPVSESEFAGGVDAVEPGEER